MSLDDLRQRLTAVDSELLELIAERQRIVAEVGAHKIETGTPTRDYERERDILGRAHRQADELGLDASASPTTTSRYRSLRSRGIFLVREIYFYTAYLLVNWLS